MVIGWWHGEERERPAPCAAEAVANFVLALRLCRVHSPSRPESVAQLGAKTVHAGATHHAVKLRLAKGPQANEAGVVVLS